MKEFLKWLENYEDISDVDAEYITVHLSTFGLKEQILYNLLKKYSVIFYKFFDEQKIIILMDDRFLCSISYFNKNLNHYDIKFTNFEDDRITAEVKAFIIAFNILENNALQQH